MSEHSTGKGKVWLAILLIVVIILFGVGGYMTIEGFSLSEALYMTIITISTVGFREVKPLSEPGMIFTVILIASGIGTLAYSIGLLTRIMIEKHISRMVFGIRKKSKLRRMEKHVIICGFGRNGKQAAADLSVYGEKVVVIEKDRELIPKMESLGYFPVIGDATEEEVLLAAGVEKAKAIIASIPIDADNLYVALSARALNQGINIICRASDESNALKLQRAGADHVILPEKVGGSRMANMVVRPDTTEFLRYIALGGTDQHTLWEVKCDELICKTPNPVSKISISAKIQEQILLVLKPPMVSLKSIRDPKQFLFQA
ncbi:MAG: potassium channel protein [Bacteroidetes bacterium HGW-Bacteroidetes-6]|jgi:voltage-gated potassium channel|nr:MAG: potassium channel protein [Bacteroidetes bacterium HGW-Bacteroidetes-6]